MGRAGTQKSEVDERKAQGVFDDGGLGDNGTKARAHLNTFWRCIA